MLGRLKPTPFDSVLVESTESSLIYGREITLYRYYLESIEKILAKARVYVVNSANGEDVNLRLIDEAQTPALQTTGINP